MSFAACWKDRHARVVAVTDGQAALQVATTEPFDVIFLDARMPALSGIETATKLRDAGTNARLILLSASLDAKLQAEAAALDLVTLQKPVGRAELETALAALQPHGRTPELGASRPEGEKGRDAEPPISRQAACAGASELIAALASAVDNRQEDIAARLAHSLLGLSAQFGLNALARLTAAVESRGHAVTAEDVASMQAALILDAQCAPSG